MNLNPLPWLLGCVLRPELGKWTSGGIIQPDQERRIGERYDSDCCGLTLGECAKLTLFALSTIAMLLALVLIVADHWREIYLPFKVSLALIAMSVAHSAGYWYRFRVGQPQRGDTCFFIGTILYGCILLMAMDQYYAESPYWSASLAWALFAWAAGTLPLAWVLSSVPMLILADVLGTAWIIAHILVTGEAKKTSLFVLQALCLLRWAYTNLSRSLFVVTLSSLVVWWCMLAVAADLERAGFFWIAAAGPLLILIGRRHEETHPFGPIYEKLGTALCGLVLLPLSIPSVSRDLVLSGHTLWIWLLIVAAFGGVVAMVPAPRRMDYYRDWPVLAALAAVTVLPAALGIIGYGQGLTIAATGVLAAVYNVAVVAVIICLVVHGAKTACSASVALGIAYFCVWVTLLTINLAGNLTQAAVIFAVASAALLVMARVQSRKQVSIDETGPLENA
jgi:hypothetical protein